MSYEDSYTSPEIPLYVYIIPIAIGVVFLCIIVKIILNRRNRSEQAASAQSGVAPVYTGGVGMVMPMQQWQAPAMFQFPMAGGQGQMPFHQFPMSSQRVMHQPDAMHGGYPGDFHGLQHVHQPYM